MSPGNEETAPAANEDRSETVSHHATESGIDSTAGGDPFGDVPHTADLESSSAPDEPSWGRIDLEAILNGDFEPVEPTMFARTDGRCLVYPGLVHSFHGESESGKSLIIQIECVRLILAGQDVLYLDFESDAHSVVQRLLEFGATPAAIRTHFDYRHPEVSARNLNEEAAWSEMLSRRYALCVIDGVTDCLGVFGKNTLDNDDIATWMRQVPRAIADRTGAAVALIDHVTKSTEGRGRHAVGGQQKMNSLTGAAYTVSVREHLGKGCRGVVELRVGKDRPGGVRPHCGAFAPSDRTQLAATIVIDSRHSGTPIVTVNAPDPNAANKPFRPTGLMEKVSRFIEDHEDGPGANDIKRNVPGKAEHRVTALIALEAEGYIRTTPAARGGKAHHTIKPYRQANDPESDKYDGPGTGQWPRSA